MQRLEGHLSSHTLELGMSQVSPTEDQSHTCGLCYILSWLVPSSRYISLPQLLPLSAKSKLSSTCVIIRNPSSFVNASRPVVTALWTETKQHKLLHDLSRCHGRHLKSSRSLTTSPPFTPSLALMEERKAKHKWRYTLYTTHLCKLLWLQSLLYSF